MWFLSKKAQRDMDSQMNSRLFIGNVRHRRFTPVNHELNYSLFMPAIDVDEIDALEKKYGVLVRVGGIGLASSAVITLVKVASSRQCTAKLKN